MYIYYGSQVLHCTPLSIKKQVSHPKPGFMSSEVGDKWVTTGFLCNFIENVEIYSCIWKKRAVGF